MIADQPPHKDALFGLYISLGRATSPLSSGDFDTSRIGIETRLDAARKVRAPQGLQRLCQTTVDPNTLVLRMKLSRRYVQKCCTIN